MPELEFNLKIVARTLEDGNVLAASLGFPEADALGASPKTAREALRARLKELIRICPVHLLHQRVAPAEAAAASAVVVLDPPKRSPAWAEPVELRFDVFKWSPGENAFVAFVPELNIQVVADKEEELEERIRSHIRFALKRTGAAKSLWRLTLLQRARDVELEDDAVSVKIAAPAEAARGDGRKEKKESILKQSATELLRENLEPAFEVESLTRRLADALGGRESRSVLLVGPAGCGKTAVVHELIRNRTKLRLGATRFWTSGGSRLVAGQSGFGMWQEHCRKLAQEASSAKAILHLGNLFELMEVGKSSHNQQGIASFLRPYIARGDLQVIVECTPDQLSIIERADPHLLEVLLQIEVPEPDRDTGRLVLMSFAAQAGSAERPAITEEGLDALERLHRRYAVYSAWPGRPLRFLKNALADKARESLAGIGVAHPGASKSKKAKSAPPAAADPLTAADVTAAFSRETGLPLFLLDDAVPLDLAATRSSFASNVIGQDEAVDLVVDLMATVKARLARPRKPIASLLFIGPTGVGKTEMAKALAGFLFGDRDRLARFDMSEFGDELAVQRLIGGVSQNEGLLTAKVREQPFSVLLLDEFEKADASLYDLLLQVLGEGRLTDSSGRVADFTNTVVIMTSNLGAQSFQSGPAGFVVNSDARQDAREHFAGEVRKFLRPEMFNRIDRIVPFAPLDEETVLGIARREIGLVRKRDGIALRDVNLDVSETAIRRLAAGGFDVRYGARPLKRTIERELLAPLAEGINGYAAETALDAAVDVEGDRLAIRLRNRVDEEGRRVSTTAAGSPVARQAELAMELRRDAQRLRGCPTVLGFENTVAFLESFKARLSARKWTSPEDAKRLEPLPRLKKLLRESDALLAATEELEQETVVSIYDREELSPPNREAELDRFREEWRCLLRRAFWLESDQPDDLTFTLFAEHREALWEFASSWFNVFQDLKFKVAVYRLEVMEKGAMLSPEDHRFEVEPELRAQYIEDPPRFLSERPEGTLGVTFAVHGSLAVPRLLGETGAHEIKSKDATLQCFAHASLAPLEEYLTPAGVARKVPAEKRDVRRTIDRAKGRVNDRDLGNTALRGRPLEEVLHEAAEERLDREVRGLLD